MNYNEKYPLLGSDKHIYKSISYLEMMDFFYGLDSGLFFIGGDWCKNCQAIIKVLNDTAIKENLEVIYNYDPRFINVFKETDDLRKCSTLETKLDYYALVEKLGYKNDKLVTDTLIPAMAVPFFFSVKNGSCVGYYQIELLNTDGKLHFEDKEEDMTSSFVNSIKELISKIK